MILTQPEGEDESLPQVLARSIIRKRYTRKVAPVADDDTQLPAPSLTFFRNDSTTPLGDPSPFGALADDDQLEDVIAGSTSDLQSLLVAPDSSGKEVRDELDDGTFEVHGLPSKGPRTSINNLQPSTSNQPTPFQQLQVDSEEVLVSPLANSTPEPSDLVHS